MQRRLISQTLFVQQPMTGVFAHPENGTIIIPYDNSPCPATDAVFDTQDYFKSNWGSVIDKLGKIRDQNVFAMALSLAGVEGFPVKAVYNHIHGGRAWID